MYWHFWLSLCWTQGPCLKTDHGRHGQCDPGLFQTGSGGIQDLFGDYSGLHGVADDQHGVHYDGDGTHCDGIHGDFQGQYDGLHRDDGTHCDGLHGDGVHLSGSLCDGVGVVHDDGLGTLFGGSHGDDRTHFDGFHGNKGYHGGLRGDSGLHNDVPSGGDVLYVDDEAHYGGVHGCDVCNNGCCGYGVDYDSLHGDVGYNYLYSNLQGHCGVCGDVVLQDVHLSDCCDFGDCFHYPNDVMYGSFHGDEQDIDGCGVQVHYVRCDTVGCSDDFHYSGNCVFYGDD